MKGKNRYSVLQKLNTIKIQCGNKLADCNMVVKPACECACVLTE